MSVSFQHSWHQFSLAVVFHLIPHDNLIFSQLGIEQESITIVKVYKNPKFKLNDNGGQGMKLLDFDTFCFLAPINNKVIIDKNEL